MSLVSSDLLFYIGKDEEFWRDLRQDLRAIKSDIRFAHVMDERFWRSDSLARRLVKEPPRILLIDFSMPIEGLLRLVFNLKAEFRSQNVALVGLFNNLENRVLLKKALSLGIPTALIKELGTLELTQSLLDLLNPERVLESTKEKELTLEAQNLMRLGFVASDYLHIESSWRFAPGEEVHLELEFAEDFKLPPVFKIIRAGDKNVYSSAKFWQDLEPVYLDDARLFVLSRRLKTYKDLFVRAPKNKKLQLEVSLIQNDIDLLIQKAYKAEASLSERFKTWMGFNSEQSRPKRTRVMVFDKQMRLLGEDKDFLDRFPYSLRCYSKVHDDETLIHRNLPGIIVFDEHVGFDYADVKKIIQLCSKEEAYRPLLVFFSCSQQLDQLKKELNYSSLLVQEQFLSLKILQTMVESYEKANGRLSTHGLSYGDKEERFYFSKYDERSVASFVMEFKVRRIGERAIVFSSSRPIPHQSTFYIKYPFKMSLTVFRCSGLADDESLGLIHGIGREEKEQLLQLWENL